MQIGTTLQVTLTVCHDRRRLSKFRIERSNSSVNKFQQTETKHPFKCYERRHPRNQFFPLLRAKGRFTRRNFSIHVLELCGPTIKPHTGVEKFAAQIVSSVHSNAKVTGFDHCPFFSALIAFKKGRRNES